MVAETPVVDSSSCVRCKRSRAMHEVNPTYTCGTFYESMPDLGPKTIGSGPGFEIQNMTWAVWDLPWGAKHCGLSWYIMMPFATQYENCSGCGSKLHFVLRKLIKKEGVFVEDMRVYEVAPQ